jgi:hypothetical protein
MKLLSIPATDHPPLSVMNAEEILSSKMILSRDFFWQVFTLDDTASFALG